jgi:2-oxo-4-hydroxy-4-carboxy-5-ureidoimidazoline decarboxylase
VPATEKKLYTVDHINSLSREDFVAIIGPVFEHSPWIAETSWLRRPFNSLEHLHDALCETVRTSSQAGQLELIRAHPDLVGRAALAGTLTQASTSEQASAGLNNLSTEEMALFRNFNQSYREKFDFPFVICARLNKKDAILNGFRVRLQHSRKKEIETALAEIEKIAYLRLQDIIED